MVRFEKEMDNADWEEYNLIKVGREFARDIWQYNVAVIGILANYNLALFSNQNLNNEFSELVSLELFKKSIDLTSKCFT